jgi:hypothetical protein
VGHDLSRVVRVGERGVLLYLQTQLIPKSCQYYFLRFLPDPCLLFLPSPLPLPQSKPLATKKAWGLVLWLPALLTGTVSIQQEAL